MQNADEVVTVATLRNEFQVTDASRDTRIELIRDQAIELVERRTGLPLIDRDVVLQVLRPVKSIEPIRLDAWDVKAVVSVQFWQTTDTLRLEPTGMIDVAGLGRLVQASYPFYYPAIYPPMSGWPTILEDSCFVFTVKRGLEVVDKGTLASIVLTARQLFQGQMDRHSAERMITDSQRRKGALVPYYRDKSRLLDGFVLNTNARIGNG